MPIPGELWAQAVSLADEHELRTIARGLPVDYAALKKGLELAAPPTPRSPAFIEIPSARPTAVHEPREAVVEITRPDGARMLICLPGQGPLDVAGLTASFCGGAR